MNKSHNFSLIIILALLLSCSGSQDISRLNFAYIYDVEHDIIRPDFKVFHLDENKSTLYFTINTEEALYTKVYNDTISTANLKIRYKLFEKDIDIIVDSATYDMVDTGGNNSPRDLYGQLILNAPPNRSYELEIRVRDVNRDLNTIHFYTFNKYNTIAEENFLLLDSNFLPLINNQTQLNEKIYLIKSPFLENFDFTINYYEDFLSLPPPPFADQGLNYQIPATSDSSFSFKIEDTLSLTFKKKGNFILLKNQEEKTNNLFSIQVFENGFPNVQDLDLLIESIRYISTQKEFDAIKNATNKKEAVDNFWLNISNDFNRAKQILYRYYQRVETSNRFFTEVQAGWRTDRGLIAIIFGPPSVIYKSFDHEQWIYGEETNMLSVSFKFNRLESPLSKNIYILDRNNSYKNLWYKAVENWRQGRVY